MTNISEDRKVVLAALREVPYETAFLLSDAVKDQSIKNRYWFDLPNQWTHQANKDPIIGIRDIYFTKCYRYLVYEYQICLIRHNHTTKESEATWLEKATGTIFSWVEGDTTLKETCIDFSKKWIESNINPTQKFEVNSAAGDTVPSSHTWESREINSWISFDSQAKQTYIYFGRHEGDDELIEYTGKDNNSYYYRYQIQITPKNEEAKLLFNSQTMITGWDRVRFPVDWSRYQCLVKSSIANNDANNILGHTRNDSYTPIKYYRLNRDVKKFWIELYETRCHDIPVSIPSDKRDDLIIEAIVCFTSQAML